MASPTVGFCDNVVPMLNGELGGEGGSSAGVAVVEDLYRRVVQIVLQRPRHCCVARPPDVAADPCCGRSENGSDLPVAQAELLHLDIPGLPE